jgi:hypothetical protein
VSESCGSVGELELWRVGRLGGPVYQLNSPREGYTTLTLAELRELSGLIVRELHRRNVQNTRHKAEQCPVCVEREANLRRAYPQPGLSAVDEAS